MVSGSRPILPSIVALFLVGAAGCSEEQLGRVAVPAQSRPNADTPATDVPDTCQTGGLTGTLCIPSTPSPLAGATVSATVTDCHGESRTEVTTTAVNGAFSLADLPATLIRLRIEHSAYNGLVTVDIPAGGIAQFQSDDPDDPVCSEAAPSRLAVIAGVYDAVEEVLGSLGLSFDVFSDSGDYYSYADDYGASGGVVAGESDDLLRDRDALAEYDVLFFNCGTSAVFPYSDAGVEDTAIVENLRAFVAGGGSIYASDWAWNIAEAMDESRIDWWGSEEAGDGRVLSGDEATITGKLEDPALAAFMGGDEVDITFDLPSWAVIDGVSSSTDIFVTGSFSLTEFDDFTWESSTEHLAKRPLLVGFTPFPGGGYVLYTTFHYHAQLDAEMLDVLRYLIFQL